MKIRMLQLWITMWGMGVLTNARWNLDSSALQINLESALKYVGKEHSTALTFNVMTETLRMVMVVTRHVSLKRALIVLEELQKHTISAMRFVEMV